MNPLSIRAVILLAIGFLVACASDKGSSGESSPLGGPGHSTNSPMIYPIRGLPNLGGTCYFNMVLQMLRKLERHPVVAISASHQSVLDEFALIMSRLEVDTQGQDQKVVDRGELTRFVSTWNEFAASPEFRHASLARKEDHVNHCQIRSGGIPHLFYACLAEMMGYFPRIDIQLSADKNSFESIQGGIPNDLQRVFVKVKSSNSVKFPMLVSKIIVVDNVNFRIIGCSSNVGHAAVVEDRAVMDGVEKMEIFHYADDSVTWIPKDVSDPKKECMGLQLELVLERN